MLRRAAGAARRALAAEQRARALSASAGAAAAAAPGGPGLFGIAALQHPADFPAWAEDAKARCGELVAAALATPPDASVVRLIDDISDALCQVYDAAECARNVHADAAWRAAAGQACQVLGEFLADINHHTGLYNKLVQAQEAHAAAAAAAAGDDPAGRQLRQQLLSPAQLAGFCDETLAVAGRYRADFEKYGIHLPSPDARRRVARLLALNQHFPARFNATLADPRALGTTGVPADELPRAEAARRQVYLAGACAPAANLALLDDMLAARHDLAASLGHASYAHFKAADATLAGTPAAAQAFLEDLAAGVRGQATAELAQLTALKRKHTGDAGATLQPWDQDFYARQLASGAAAGARGGAALAPYLSLGSVLAGLDALLGRLMGLSLTQRPLGRGEGWGAGVMKLEVCCAALGPLGVLYLDLRPRPGKVPSGGILYPVRCGRELTGGEYQQPVLCLVGNLSSASAASGTADMGATQLSWREFRTLLHETGHAVHSLVSRTRYQHVWGTRCSQDVVECPRTSGSTLRPTRALLSLVDLVYHGPTLPAEAGGTSEVPSSAT
ncbi:OCT1 [Scenedesmus sp. PABB004]|nr:OCT1 [Scenedesmus sp. PABB004]